MIMVLTSIINVHQDGEIRLQVKHDLDTMDMCGLYLATDECTAIKENIATSHTFNWLIIYGDDSS